MYFIKNLFLITKKILGVCLCLLAISAHANINPTQTDATNAYHECCATIATAKSNAANITKFYAPNALLLPTLSPKILIKNHDSFDTYFTRFSGLSGIKCETNKLITRIYNDIAINDGLYTFSYMEAGKIKVVPAHFTLVYEKKLKQWLIITHHSSKLP